MGFDIISIIWLIINIKELIKQS